MSDSKEKEPITYQDAITHLGISKLELRTIFAIVFEKSIPELTDEILAKNLTLLCLASLLEGLVFLTAPQRLLILRSTSTNLDPHIFYQLVFADEKYCTWTGATGWLELETGDMVKDNVGPFIETIGYNLSELFRRHEIALKHKVAAHDQKHYHGSLDKS